MAFRYHILFYHENQAWVSDIAALLDVPLFHLYVTDLATSVEKKLKADAVDVILTGLNTQHFLLGEDEANSLTFKRTRLWEAIEKENSYCQVILICNHQESGFAADLVQQGKITDYFMISPMMDKDRLLTSILKAVETGLFRSIIEQKYRPQEKLPRHMLESLEALETLLTAPEPEPQQSIESWLQPEPVEDLNILPSALETPAPEEAEPLEVEQKPPPPISIFATLGEEAPHESAVPPENFFASLNQTLHHGGDTVETAPSPPRWWGKDVEAPVYDPTLESDDTFQPLTSVRVLRKSDFRVLLVEAHPENTTLLEGLLAGRGYTVLIANTAGEGFYHLNQATFELLILNLDLPDVNGLDLLRKIRTKGPQEHIPVIILAETPCHEDVLECAELEASHFIAKPFDTQRLLENVGDLLKKALHT